MKFPSQSLRAVSAFFLNTTGGAGYLFELTKKDTLRRLANKFKFGTKDSRMALNTLNH